jgi:hypothetical protein
VSLPPKVLGMLIILSWINDIGEESGKVLMIAIQFDRNTSAKEKL